MSRRRERRKHTQNVGEGQPYGPTTEKKPMACNVTYHAEIRANTKQKKKANEKTVLPKRGNVAFFACHSLAIWRGGGARGRKAEKQKFHEKRRLAGISKFATSCLVRND